MTLAKTTFDQLLIGDRFYLQDIPTATEYIKVKASLEVGSKALPPFEAVNLSSGLGLMIKSTKADVWKKDMSPVCLGDLLTRREISSNIFNPLKAAGVKDLKELHEYSLFQLSTIRHLGPALLLKLAGVASKYGILFKPCSDTEKAALAKYCEKNYAKYAYTELEKFYL